MALPATYKLYTWLHSNKIVRGEFLKTTISTLKTVEPYELNAKLCNEKTVEVYCYLLIFLYFISTYYTVVIFIFSLMFD